MKEAAERNQRLLMIGFVRRFENGAILSVETSFSLNMEQKSDTGMQFFGTAAGVDYDKDIHLFSELDGYLTNVELADLKMSSFDECFSKEIGHFIDCINGKATCLNPAEDGVEMMKILCAIYRSAESGHEEVL